MLSPTAKIHRMPAIDTGREHQVVGRCYFPLARGIHDERKVFYVVVAVIRVVIKHRLAVSFHVRLVLLSESPYHPKIRFVIYLCKAMGCLEQTSQCVNMKALPRYLIKAPCPKKYFVAGFKESRFRHIYACLARHFGIYVLNE